MHVGEILTADSANGIGIRVTVFVSGCTNHCKGCFQPQTWDFNYGREWDKTLQDFVIQELSKPYYHGLTLLGGEPFELANQRELVKFLRRVKEECPGKTIWSFTGFILDKDLVPGGKRHCEVTDEMLGMLDMLVDGPFIEEQKELMLRFRGSRNQRIIDMNETRRQGKIVIWSGADKRN